jgi:hypothetical protein
MFTLSGVLNKYLGLSRKESFYKQLAHVFPCALFKIQSLMHVLKPLHSEFFLFLSEFSVAVRFSHFSKWFFLPFQLNVSLNMPLMKRCNGENMRKHKMGIVWVNRKYIHVPYCFV